ncbi:MAG: hypothetical protein VX777_01850 [Chlamydiota bacterium]|nr:hypothetical protein [Chlamydiota bacterium]
MKKALSVNFFILLLSLGVCFAETQNSPDDLKYFDRLNHSEEQGIRYIITTLGSKSTISLLWYRDSLEKAGNQINDVHPLRFWKEVLTDPKLKMYSRKIGGVPKRQMVADFANSLETVARRGQLKPEYLQDFIEATGLDGNLIYYNVNNGQWKALVELFFNDNIQSRSRYR